MVMAQSSFGSSLPSGTFLLAVAGSCCVMSSGYSPTDEMNRSVPGRRVQQQPVCLKSLYAIENMSRLPQCAQCVVPDVDSCRYDIATCNGLSPGAACQMNCRAPYTGVGTVAYCPASSVMGIARLNGTLPHCKLECPDPDPLPDAYERRGGSLRCSSCYVGLVR